MKLTNYDPLEEALLERPVAEIRTRPFLSVPPQTSVQAAMELMVAKRVGCVLVVDGDRLVGLFSERDVLDRVAERYREVRESPIAEFMTTNPAVVYDDDPAAAALCAMAACGYRHVPVLDLDEKITGLVGPLRMLTFIQEHLDTP